MVNTSHIPTEPIGSVPRPQWLQQAMQAHAAGTIADSELDAQFDRAVRETIEQFEATGSPIVTDGEQAKSSFATYTLEGLENIAPGGVIIPFEDGHTRQLPRLTRGPFRYGVYAGSYLPRAQRFATKPLKQSVISPSAMSLLYPQDGIPGYSRVLFLDDYMELH